MKLMKTAEEMMQFCIDNNTGYYSFKYLNHFKVIEECLQADEYALLCFEGAQLVDLAYNSIKDRRYSFALTNKRLFMGQRSKMGDDLQIAWYKDLNDMELMNDSLLVDAAKSWPCIQVVTEGVPCLQERLPGIMGEIKRQNASRRKGLQAASAADEIRKFKGLLDDGIITEEEYQRKKEQLLNGDDFSESPGTDITIDINPADYVPVDEVTAEVGVKELDTEQPKKRKTSDVYLPGIVFGGILLLISLIGFIYAASS